MVVAKPGHTGVRRILRASNYSMQGLRHAFIYESAFRQELALTLILSPVAFWLGRTGFETAVLLAALLLMLVVELLNTAIEVAIDRHGDELHDLSGAAKDLASAAVLLSLVLAFTIWAGVAWDRFLA